jgi:uncharacterized OB-fold protein
MDLLSKVELTTWISLAPHALFTLKQVYSAAKIELECANCGDFYTAALDRCPKCQSTKFAIDYSVLDGIEIGAFLRVEKDQKGEKDVNVVEKYFSIS